MFTHLLYIACVGKRREQVATDRDRLRRIVRNCVHCVQVLVAATSYWQPPSWAVYTVRTICSMWERLLCAGAHLSTCSRETAI